jgi:putative heme-binding domain-containing protein
MTDRLRCAKSKKPDPEDTRMIPVWQNRLLATTTLTLCSLFAIGSLGLGQEPAGDDSPDGERPGLWDKENLVAWCIVPFDSQRRTPEQRAAMLQRIGIEQLAYDYRAEHIPTFDAEIEALRAHDIRLTAWWFPGDLNDEARHILDVLERHQIQTQLWVTGGGQPTTDQQQQRERVASEAERIGRIARAAAKIGCTVGLYNHGGWFGEAENQLAIIEALKMPNVGIVYNLHHGHHHLGRFAEILQQIKPHLLALNLNGMTAGGDQQGKKILPIGAGEWDLRLVKIIEQSGYRGPIGILNHTDLDAEKRLLDNLDGLRWVVACAHGQTDVDPPTYRSWDGPPADYLAAVSTIGKSSIESPLDSPAADSSLADSEPTPLSPADTRRVAEISAAAGEGDPIRGMQVFASAKFACLSCHKVGQHGGAVGPPLTEIATQRTRQQVIESLLWPQRHVDPAYRSNQVLTSDGSIHGGYIIDSSADTLVIKDPSTGELERIAQSEIEFLREVGSVMPVGLTDAMRPSQLADLVAFMDQLGRWNDLSAEVLDDLLRHWTATEPASFAYELGPLEPDSWSELDQPINQNRLFDYYGKQAVHFGDMTVPPPLLAEFPGLDGSEFGHWGNQNEAGWADDRWNDTVLGSVQAGVFRGAGIEVPRSVCVRLGGDPEMSACFNPQTLSYDAVWAGGFVRFSSVRHGFMDGLIMDGELVPGAATPKVDGEFSYHGFYRVGSRVVFAYAIGDTEYLDAPGVVDGQFVRDMRPRDQHPLTKVLGNGQRQWPQSITTPVTMGNQSPYAVDRIGLPTDNPWNALIFCGDHDFLPNGDALVCTMQGDVWQVSELDGRDGDGPSTVTWKRFAAGLHQALGLLVEEDGIYVLGRDQITRLKDLNQDGEADLYEAFCTSYITSPAGHDFICGLQRDEQGNFYTASGNQGVLRISPDGETVEVVATGFRNPDGLGIRPDGTLTVPCSEGTWTPASMICEIAPESNQPYFGYPGPIDEQPPQLPLVYLPRGVDNSSGGQVYIDSDRWGPLKGNMIHLSFGAGTYMLLLRDEVDGHHQGAVVRMPGDFSSGVHRGRFSPKDGQLYVSGMAGWGSYSTEDGCFARVRYRGAPVHQPIGFHVHQNGVMVEFSSPLDRDFVSDPQNHFAQIWNYRYSAAYGSPEYSTFHSGVRGHDTLPIRSAHVMDDGRRLFLEIPDLQPVNQLHLHLGLDQQRKRDMFITVHRLDTPFEDFAGYRSEPKVVSEHPILADMRLATNQVPNPHAESIEGARPIAISTATNLAFATRKFTVAPGEKIALTLTNPDVVPHNWALLNPGTEQQVGEKANRMIGDPEAVARQYVPDSPDVLVYTDIVEPKSEFTVYFTAPTEEGSYPYLCTFPGHWMVMRGTMIVSDSIAE